jgi:hypothetical protein
MTKGSRAKDAAWRFVESVPVAVLVWLQWRIIRRWRRGFAAV